MIWLLLAACHRAPAEPAPVAVPEAALPGMAEPACARDEDCVLTGFTGCCTRACPAPVFAAPKAELARRQDVCAVVECSGMGEPDCPTGPAPTRAVCVGGRCAAQ